MNLRGVKRVRHGVRDPDVRLHRQRASSMIGGRCWSGSLSATRRGAESRRLRDPAEHQADRAGCVVLLALRAFASGCTALTGVEAVSNGVPNFKPPKSRNAADTLAIMGGAHRSRCSPGITALALVSDVHVADDAAPTDRRAGRVRAAHRHRPGRGRRSSARRHSLLFFAVQAFTAAILVLAANTAYNGFPILASILGRRRLPAAAVRTGAATGSCSATAS